MFRREKLYIPNVNLNMKKLALLFIGALLCNSCFLIQQGRIADGMCRPKHPKFKLIIKFILTNIWWGLV